MDSLEARDRAPPLVLGEESELRAPADRVGARLLVIDGRVGDEAQARGAAPDAPAGGAYLVHVPAILILGDALIGNRDQRRVVERP